MRKALLPFQEIGAQFLASNYHALLGDEMGLGKTVQALAAYERVAYNVLRTAVVVCPASVRANWRREITECLGADALQRFTVISYNEAVNFARMTSHAFDVLILDEAHYLKSLDAQRTVAVLGKDGIARRAQYKWALTGTPVLNRPIELYPILRTLSVGSIEPYTTLEKFGRQFCAGRFDGHAMNYRGASNLDELRSRLSGFMLRREQREVLKELPDARVNRVPVELSAAELRQVIEVEQELATREQRASPTAELFSQLGDLATLLRVTGLAKVRACADYVETLVECGVKVALFAHHRDVIDALALRFPGCSVFRGGMTDAQKTLAVRRFVSDENCTVFIGNIKAAGTGIDGLQKVCYNVAFAELSWVPGEMDQCIGRVKRMGLMPGAKRVNVHVLHAPGTLESAVLATQDHKSDVIRTITRGA